VAENRHIGGVFAFFETLGAKNTVNTDVGSLKPQYLRFFFASGSKHNGIYSVFWLVPSQNIGIYAVFSMLQEALLPCQRHKNTVNYSVLALGRHRKNSKHPPQSARNGGPPKSIL